uniref:Protein RFT1 homolog isoform X2 n=1 Tax=Rhizophora mucronata TaxID=61149 RepID=A0A2P2LI80_RHIMU
MNIAEYVILKIILIEFARIKPTAPADLISRIFRMT